MLPLPSYDHTTRAVIHACSALVGTPPEERFDRIIEVAVALFGVPFAGLNLLSDACLWTKAGIGLTPGELALDIAFCTHTLALNQPLIVSDLREDVRFAENSLVLGEPHCRFYAGVPIRNTEGRAWATLCIVDTTPRELTGAELHLLECLAGWAEREMAVTELSDVLLRQQITEQKLRESELRYRTVLDALSEGVVLQDESGAICAANSSAERILGLSIEELTGRTNMDPRWQAIREDDTPFPGEEHPASVALRTGTPQSDQLLGIHKPDGSRTWLTVNARPLFHEAAAQPYAVVASFVDITEQKRTQRQLKLYQQQLQSYNSELTRLATTDGLTDLVNKRMLLEMLEMEVERAHMLDTPLSLIMLDVDHFKSYNDTYGHPAGDEVLKQVAALLRACARGADIVARYGGEEFTVLLPNTNAADALRVAERLRLSIAENMWPYRDITASLGIATFTATIETSSALIEAADRALYTAKHDGRNRAVFLNERTFP